MRAVLDTCAGQTVKRYGESLADRESKAVGQEVRELGRNNWEVRKKGKRAIGTTVMLHLGKVTILHIGRIIS